MSVSPSVVSTRFSICLGVTHPLKRLAQTDHGTQKIIPVPILPALMILDGDLDCVAEFALQDFDTAFLAFFVLATCAVVGRSLCTMVSILSDRKMHVSDLV